MRFKHLILAVGVLAVGTGCEQIATQQKADQLSRVAKDWCLTIRASEVMPTYPLTEDIQPGDIFLVTRTIDQEVQDYTDEGFLPL